MKFNFKKSDIIRCEVMRTTNIAQQRVHKGDVVDMLGAKAIPLMTGPMPALKQIEGHAPEPYVERDTEVVVETRDPVKAKPKAKPKAKGVAPAKKYVQREP